MHPASPAAPPESVLTRRRLVAFATPLVATSLLMTAAGPVLDVALARAHDPRLELAAFWIAFTVVLTLQSAGQALQHATLAAGASRGTVRRLAVLALGLGGGATLLTLAVAHTALGDAVFGGLLPTTARVAERARAVLAMLAPLPLLVAARGLANGVVIRTGRTDVVAAAAFARTAVIAGMVGVVVALGRGAGAGVAALALVAGTALEVAMVAVVAATAWPELEVDRAATHRPGWRDLARLSAPLVLAAILWTVTRPVVNGVLGRLADPELAQAAFGVVLPILMVSCSPLWALQETSVVIPRGPGDVRRVARFAAEAGLAFALAIALVTLTPLRSLVLERGFRLPPELVGAVAPALAFLALEPLALAGRAVAQGVLLRARRTEAFLVVAPLRLALMLGVGLAVAHRFPAADGAKLGLLLLIGGDVFDALAYGWQARRVLARTADPGWSARPGARVRARRVAPAGIATDRRAA